MRVHHLERAKGVHPRMLVLLQQWQLRGPFEIVVGMHGGLRTDPAVQTLLSGSGMSAASSLRVTPHGRAGALDLWPLAFLEHVPVASGGTAKRWTSWEGLPQVLRDQFAIIGLFSEALNFRWGGRWLSKTYPNGDQPHHELSDWQRLPFPPPTYEFPADLAALSSERHA